MIVRDNLAILENIQNSNTKESRELGHFQRYAKLATANTRKRTVTRVRRTLGSGPRAFYHATKKYTTNRQTPSLRSNAALVHRTRCQSFRSCCYLNMVADVVREYTKRRMASATRNCSYFLILVFRKEAKHEHRKMGLASLMKNMISAV